MTEANDSVNIDDESELTNDQSEIEIQDASKKHFALVDKSSAELKPLANDDIRLDPKNWSRSEGVYDVESDAFRNAVLTAVLFEKGCITVFVDRDLIWISATSKNIQCQTQLPLVECLSERFSPFCFDIDPQLFKRAFSPKVYWIGNLRSHYNPKKHVLRIGSWHSDPITNPNDVHHVLSLNAPNATRKAPINIPHVDAVYIPCRSLTYVLDFLADFFSPKPLPWGDHVFVEEDGLYYAADTLMCRIQDQTLSQIKAVICRDDLSMFRKVLRRYGSDDVSVSLLGGKMYIARKGLAASIKTASTDSKPVVDTFKANYDAMPDIRMVVARDNLFATLMMVEPALMRTGLSSLSKSPKDRTLRLLRIRIEITDDGLVLDLDVRSQGVSF